jgi:hypothetical protein
MDLSKFNTQRACDISASVKLRNPFTAELLKDENGNYLEIQIMGFHSTAARNILTAQKRRRNSGTLSDEDAGAELLAILTTGWSDNVQLGGERLEFSRANAQKLYLSESWVANQVTAFAAELGNYNPES